MPVFIDDLNFILPKTKKNSDQVDIFEQTNWDFIHEFSNILGVIKVRLSQRFYGFKRIENFLKTIDCLDLFDVQIFKIIIRIGYN